MVISGFLKVGGLSFLKAVVLSLEKELDGREIVGT